MKTFNKYILMTLVLTFGFGCSNSEILTGSYGKLTVKLTDAPMPYAQFMEANITVDKIEIGNSLVPDSFIMLVNEPMTYNMLELINGITETMANADIPVGEYDTLRLYISMTEMIMNNGNIYNYNMNEEGFSGNGMMQNGMMLNNENRSIDISLENMLTVFEGSHDEFLLDIDIDNSFMLQDVSFVDTGSGMMINMSGFTFNPTMRFVNMNNSGTFERTVHYNDNYLANATLTLMHGESLYITTHTDENGHYSFIGVPEGSYTMVVQMEGFMLNTVGNVMNMGELEMMTDSVIDVDFDMIPIE